MGDSHPNRKPPILRGFSARTVYTCDLCGLETTNQDEIIDHIETHQNDDLLPPSTSVTDSMKFDELGSTLGTSTSTSLVERVNQSERSKSGILDSISSSVNGINKAYSSTLSVNSTAGVEADYILTEANSDDDSCEVLDALVEQVVNSVGGLERGTDAISGEHQKTILIYKNNSLNSERERNHSDVINDGKYSCVECVKRFTSLRGLNIHKSVHRKKDVVTLVGDKLAQHGTTPTKVEIPVPVLILEHTQEPSCPPCICLMCSKQLQSKHALAQHMQLAHANGTPFKSVCCGELFRTSSAYSRHIRKSKSKSCVSCEIPICDRVIEHECKLCESEQLNEGKQTDEPETAQVATEVDILHMADEVDQATLLTIGNTVPGNRHFVCSYVDCGRRFNWKSNLRRHMHTHGPDVTHDDDDCGWAFDYETNLNTKEHVKNGNGRRRPAEAKPKPFACSICGQLFTWQHNLRRHMRRGHVDTTLNFATKDSNFHHGIIKQERSDQDEDFISGADQLSAYCSQSGMEADLVCQDSLLEIGNFPAVRLIESTKCVCNICGEQFFWESNLRRHMRLAHSSKDSNVSRRIRNQTCGKCGRRFAQLYHLRVHMAAHANAERVGTTKRYLCSDCGRGCGDARQLRVHMLRHAGIKPHQCSLCSKSYTVLTELKEHIATKHEGRRLVCEHCGHEASSRSALHTHVRYVHPAPGSVRPFCCTVCSRGFWSAASLKRHESAHADSGSSKRKAMCSVCNMRFRHVYNLGHHIRTIHTIVEGLKTPFACGTCGEQFENGEAFKSHYRSKHRNR